MTKTTELQNVPIRANRWRGDLVKLELGAMGGSDGTDKRRTFKLRAYTGKKVQLWYWGPYVIDLEGVEFKQQVPALLDHDAGLRVGFTEKVSVDNGAIVCEGTFLTNENATTILRDADDGFPWQVSVGVDHVEVQRLFQEETALVNGQVVAGPCLIARKTILREVSLVSLGADDDTTAAAASANVGATVQVAISHEGTQMTKTTETPAQPPATLTAAQVREAHPAQVAELAAGAAQAAVAAERDRVTAILEACDGEQAELGRELVKSGASVGDATAKLHADLKAKLAASRSATLGGKQTTTSLSGGNSDENTNDPQGKLRAQFPSDERGQKAFEAYLKRNPDASAKA